MLYVEYPSWIHPQIFSFLPIRWYGLMYLFAYATAYIIMIRLIKKEKNVLLEDLLPNMILWIFIGMILGARFVSELVYSKNIEILYKPWLLIWPFHHGKFVGIQGMSYHGGLAGMLISFFLYCKIKKLSFLDIADKFVISASLGYTFGRLGNFTNGELYGRITSSPLGMLFKRAELLPIADDRVKQIADKVGIAANEFGYVNLPRHASQLYEAFFEGIVIFVILISIYTIIKKMHIKSYIKGTLVGLYIMLYGLTRFIIEYFRQPDSNLDFVVQFSDKANPIWLFVSPFNFTTGQVLSSIMFLCGLIFMIILIVANTQQKNKSLIKVVKR